MEKNEKFDHIKLQISNNSSNIYNTYAYIILGGVCGVIVASREFLLLLLDYSM